MHSYFLVAIEVTAGLSQVAFYSRSVHILISANK